jgi:DnaK suppressor protein
MTKLDLDSMRTRLQAMRSEFAAEDSRDADASAVVELDQARVGRLSRIDAMQQQEMSMASDRRRAQMAGKIEAAISRIDNDDFGYCRACENLIDPRRLEFDPTLLLCVECAEKGEA